MTEHCDFDGRRAWHERRARPSMLRVSRITMLHLGALLSSLLAASLTTSQILHGMSVCSKFERQSLNVKSTRGRKWSYHHMSFSSTENTASRSYSKTNMFPEAETVVSPRISKVSRVTGG